VITSRAKVATGPGHTAPGERSALPRPTLSVPDAVAIIIGVVLGAGIFRTPSLVAANTASEEVFLLAWLLGGAVSLVGALCYAELATAYPHTGGDYHYLSRAFGGGMGFLFGYSRMTVIQTGSIAMLAFVIGDYASLLLRLGERSESVYAAAAVVSLTALNVAGLRYGRRTQNVLTATKVLGLLAVIVAGLVWGASPAAPVASGQAPETSFGLAMVFVLLAYGGWNEAAYISAEVRDRRRSMSRALLWGIGLITAIFLLANLAYLRGLGLTAMSQSEVVAAELMRRVAGEDGARFVSVLIAVAALAATNATIMTGARSSYALGRDLPRLRALGRWHERANAPANALVAQGVAALALVAFGSLTRDGFATMVGYTAPVFWLFFLLTGVSLFVLRRKDPKIARPFQVPFYPLTPLLFCLVCLYMLQASLVHAGAGALVGVAVLLTGLPLLWLARRSS
jgi:APA family basic amino acid/polyamine antiporter